VYVRTVGERELNFAVSGKLWNRSLVMRDRETGTLWSHLLGEAMEGELKGTKLEMISSQMTDWRTWREQQPETTVVNLSRTSKEYRRDFYRDPSLFVLGLRVGMKTKAWAFDELVKKRVVNDQVGDLPVVIFFDQESLTAQVFERRIDEQELRFRAVDERIVDLTHGSLWDGLKGKALNGPAEGKNLVSLPGIVSGLTPWVTFHPETEGLSMEAIEHAKENSFLRRSGRRGNRRK
jgi:hypothetical protein